jgi:hypothetical protein
MAIPPATEARARLAGRLAELSQPHAAPTFRLGQWVVACVIVLAVAGGATFIRGTNIEQPGRSGLRVFLLPDADLTPGLARPVTVAEMCGAERHGRTQPISAVVHDGVFARYGADPTHSAAYELDYLITPELGGVPDARNLWPQPFTGTVWNAYVKDELELHLHRLVCDGAIDFAAAQRELATDWIAAYKRRFQSERPLRDYAANPLHAGDAEFLRAELEELGVTLPDARADGPTLMALWQVARHEVRR